MYKVNDKIRARVFKVGKTYGVDNTPDIFEWLITAVDVAGNIIGIKHADGTVFDIHKSVYMLTDIELITEPVKYRVGDIINADIEYKSRNRYNRDFTVSSVSKEGHILEVKNYRSVVLSWPFDKEFKVENIKLKTPAPRESPLKSTPTPDLQVYLKFAYEIGDLDMAQKITNEIAIRFNLLKSEL